MAIEPAQQALQIKSLRRSPSSSAYLLYRAALEWELTDPILIHDRKDLKSEAKWRDHISPYSHQVRNLISFCRRLPVTLLADDVGLGKTISAGLIASELMARGRISKILIVCPKLLIEQWKEELETKFGIGATPAIGRDLITAKPPDGVGAVITTYQSARTYLEQLNSGGFDMLVLDEAHKLRNLYGVDQSPKVAQRFRQALADRMFKYVLMLTATPIQNRLWDVYSLVDLLTIARGHENPFGPPGIFARNYISDDHDKARRLNPQMRDEFRSIVYRYMSRVRRGDANLHFPERVVQLHKVDPSSDELELISIVGKSIENLNRLAQISILQALTSSPDALNSQLRRMAENKTVPEELSIAVDKIVKRGNLTAKLRGLGALVDQLTADNPANWRMVVFTTRRETQTTIEAFLRSRSVPCGLINGDSGPRNQATIAKFRKPTPDINVIVSTEAGSEGVNLQAANVLVNFDLPWNPMIVEQRIGRIQRLSSSHATVCIFNIILRGTFEEYIVGRLMEKLQMASQAIGDLEALLGASGLSDHEEDSASAFAEKLRELVVSSLVGADPEESIRKAAKSIADAKVELEKQEKEIDAMFGEMDGQSHVEISVPDLPVIQRSKDSRTFVLEALASLGTHLVERNPNLYEVDDEGRRYLISFDESEAAAQAALFYGPGTAAFNRLASRITASGVHLVSDVDDSALAKAELISSDWVRSFDGQFVKATLRTAKRSFAGTALVRVRATVAHDSYERLLEIPCDQRDHWGPESPNAMSAVSDPIVDLKSLGIDATQVVERSRSDQGISDFCRFYTERKVQELAAAGTDARKLKKIEDDFTPRLEIVSVGLQGAVLRKLKLDVDYRFDADGVYSSELEIIPSRNDLVSAPDVNTYAPDKRAPVDALGQCAYSKRLDLKHRLVRSAISDRYALPEYTGICTISGKRVLVDELCKSDLTGHLALPSLLKVSAASSKRGEPEFFGTCEFTQSEVLKSELEVSQVSGRKFRRDQEAVSFVSGKNGHQSEFVFTSEPREVLLPSEAETCEVTGKVVRAGTLLKCEITGKNVIPSELEKSAVSRKMALKTLFVASSLSGARVLESEALVSASGKYCLVREAKPCLWSGQKFHPDDLRACQLTGITAHFEYMTTSGGSCLEPLMNLLKGISRKSEMATDWPLIVRNVSQFLDKKTRIEAAELSPSKEMLAVCLETKNWLGLNTRQAGITYSLRDNAVTGRVVIGKRNQVSWKLEKTV